MVGLPYQTPAMAKKWAGRVHENPLTLCGWWLAPDGLASCVIHQAAAMNVMMRSYRTPRAWIVNQHYSA